MKIKAITIEDEQTDSDHLKTILDGIPDVELVGQYQDIPSALASLKQLGHVDMIFSDIELPGTNGVDAAKWLKKYCDTLVFVTGHTKHALDALKQYVQYYLVKPVKSEDIIDVLEDRYGADPDRYPMRLKFGKVALYDAGKKRYIPVQPEAIIKLIAADNYIAVHVQGFQEPLLIRYTISAAAAVLKPFGLFMQISRDAVVNLGHVDHAGLDSVVCGGQEHSVSQKYQGDYLAFWRSHQVGKGNGIY